MTEDPAVCILKLVSKAGNEYEAYLVLNGPEEKYPVGMEFANKKR